MKSRLQTASFCAAGIAVLVLLALIGSEMAGVHVPGNARFLVVALLAFLFGGAAGVLGGEARLQGTTKLDVIGKTPVKFWFKGGVAIFVTVMVLGWAFYIRPGTDDPPVIVHLEQVEAEELASPPRVLVVAKFEPFTLPDNRRLYLYVASDEACSQVVAKGRVDSPRHGQMRVFAPTTRASVTCAQLIVTDGADRRVSASERLAVSWP